MRVEAGADYVAYVRHILSHVASAPAPLTFDGYDFRIFDSISQMRDEILRRDAESGLSRLVAGYAWEWKSKNDEFAHDIELDGLKLHWNSAQADWIASPNALYEVGSIHTVQGYDLNYAGLSSARTCVTTQGPSGFSSIADPTSIRRARRTTRYSARSTRTTTCFATSQTSMRYCSLAVSGAPTFMSAILRCGSTCNGSSHANSPTHAAADAAIARGDLRRPRTVRLAAVRSSAINGCRRREP